MKKFIFILMTIMLLMSFSLFIGITDAEKAGEVSLRFSLQDGNMRIVLESEEEQMRDSTAATSLASVKIEFPFQFELRKQNDFIFETIKKDRSLTIILKDISDIRAYKLSSPARLVIDLKKTRPQELIQAPEQKTQKEAAQQPGHKTQTWTTQQAGHRTQQGPVVQHTDKTFKLRTFVIDAGHGGYDYGITSADLKEKDINLNLSKDLGLAFSKKGHKVFLTRKVDQSVSLTDRINFANSKRPDVFISLHSSLSDKFVIYTSIYEELNTDDAVKLYSLSSRQIRHIEKSRGLSRLIGESIKNEFGPGVIFREMPLPLLNSMDSAAVLIEYPSLKSQGHDPRMRDRVVNALLNGIISYEP